VRNAPQALRFCCRRVTIATGLSRRSRTDGRTESNEVSLIPGGGGGLRLESQRLTQLELQLLLGPARD